MYCEHCGARLAASESKCPACGRAAAGEWLCLVVVYSPEDEIIKGLLQTAGIPVILKREGIAPLQGIYVGPLAEVMVLVPADRFEEAAELLGAVEESSEEEDQKSEDEPEA